MKYKQGLLYFKILVHIRNTTVFITRKETFVHILSFMSSNVVAKTKRDDFPSLYGRFVTITESSEAWKHAQFITYQLNENIYQLNEVCMHSQYFRYAACFLFFPLTSPVPDIPRRSFFSKHLSPVLVVGVLLVQTSLFQEILFKIAQQRKLRGKRSQQGVCLEPCFVNMN